MTKSSKYTGVCWDKTHKKWIAKIVIDKKAHNLGCFSTEKEAADAWVEYRDKYRPKKVVVSLDGEKWRLISKFGDGYYVSNKGRVKNTNFKRQGDEILLKQYEDAYGYYEVKRGYIHGKVHRLVLEAFVGKSKLGVNHKDLNPKNNCLENLEYITQRENVAHWVLSKRDYIGCSWDTYYQKWTAHIKINGIGKYIGRYDSKDEAFAAYVKALSKYGFSNKYVEDAYNNIR